ncbi:Transcription initiation factor TFIID subunit 12 [Ophidiomyces ophidiicola]|uniref:Transcription initiation factor TFIID subunit 12 n=1 Tax=Ophidiomyces ophidiicola TaxID=1387563 RepID=A0ACB8UMH8_9EURO|nr:Transcription initiation factor TFIID subunit 12 [Ophidiomyces ophidiicola]KAI1919859.1 Transcription initiation factor TFIID subunit 12 [Ophidiomyces ophidiicola]KAI1932322.1 Transcription initiation factor TFIID subunit 12 [Ophidiomyces ophidiicola]KAI1947749.1 Transcription initiation factor TFIID subunit 12 [Ophidiomyces ophidiicola]KAI1950305.1 Transcription initiation factor TFIID subunit 12 [Ophidiomyces ophidiicola]KAI2032202.1 Transcription initiation factor TFIID subunit 12 [Ophid
MENQLGLGGQPVAPPMPQNSALVRTEQVQKLPHLNDAQKQSHTVMVRGLWEILNSHPPGSNEYNNAQTKLTQISQHLLRGMRSFQATRQQQLAQQQQQQAQHIQAQAQQIQQQQQQRQQQQQPQPQPQQPAPPQPAQQAPRQPAQINRTAAAPAVTNPAAPTRPQMGVPQTFQQLLPQIRAKVDTLTFILPPTIAKEQSDGWMQEARLRYGLALQKQELGKVKLNELRQQYTQRQATGNLSQEEIQDFKNRQTAADKLLREGSEFLGKFKEQQEKFRAQTQQLAGARQGAQGTTAPTQVSADGRIAPPATSAPAPHTITSAVVAARAGQTTSAPTPTQTAAATAGVVTLATTQQPVTAAQSAPLNAFSQQTTQESPVSIQTPSAQAPPRPLSQQAAFAQAAQSYSNTMNQPSTPSLPAASHAHPANYMNSRSDTRNITMSIPKTLNVSTPEPVSMGPARPTLTSGPSHGASGVMGQPAIQKHPGFVLEGEGQHVLSKKMLDVLVKQVTGAGEGEGLTPDAEDFILQMADDFVDDVITAACRLAKLRPSATLDIRDIQLVLERNYNMRIPGFTADDLRTVKKPHPTQGWIQKMSAVQAAKVTQGRTD